MIMCKYIKDIFFPFNIFGKKKQCVSFDIPNDHSTVTLNIEWTGERLQVAWTRSMRQGGRIEHEPKRQTYTNGHVTEETIEIKRTVHPQVGVSDNRIYFNCTNVTYLSVNGMDLIGHFD